MTVNSIPCPNCGADIMSADEWVRHDCEDFHAGDLLATDVGNVHVGDVLLGITGHPVPQAGELVLDVSWVEGPTYRLWTGPDTYRELDGRTSVVVVR